MSGRSPYTRVRTQRRARRGAQVARTPIIYSRLHLQMHRAGAHREGVPSIASAYFPGEIQTRATPRHQNGEQNGNRTRCTCPRTLAAPIVKNQEAQPPTKLQRNYPAKRGPFKRAEQ